MGTPVSDKVRVCNALVSAALAGTFYKVAWSADTKLGSLDTSISIVPTGAVANEIRGTYGAQSTNKMTRQFERRTWFFQLILEFECEVSTEQFENTCLATPITLARNPDQLQGPRSIVCLPTISEYKHPPHNSGGGSRVILTFDAQCTPL